MTDDWIKGIINKRFLEIAEKVMSESNDDYTKEIKERLEKADGPYHIGHLNENVDRADVMSASGLEVADDTDYWRFLVRVPTDITNLLKEREVLREALLKARNALDSVKYDLNASIYTLKDDEFEPVIFGTRDLLDEALDYDPRKEKE